MQNLLIIPIGLSLCYSLTLLIAPVVVEGTFNSRKLLVGLATAGASIAVFCTIVAGR
jgi:hypothetical protein